MMTVWASKEIPDSVRELAPKHPHRDLSYAIMHLCRERDVPEKYFDDDNPHPKMVAECLASTLYFTSEILETVQVGQYTTLYFVY